MEQHSYGYTVKTPLGYEAAISAIMEGLKAEGFGVLTTIDVQATLKNKLGVERAPYTILGACNPPLAHRALSAEPEKGFEVLGVIRVRQSVEIFYWRGRAGVGEACFRPADHSWNT